MAGDKYDILILGGGFAGIYAAKTLRKKLSRDGYRIGIISAENHMVFQPMLPEVVGSSLSPRHVVNPIRLLCKGVDVLKGEVEKIDLATRTVVLNAGFFTPPHTLHFEHLVLTLGAKTDLSRIPGMPEHALLIQNVGDAMKLRSTIISRMEEANLETDPGIRKKLLEFIIVGGGYSGVETAGQIMDLLREIHKFYHQVDKDDFSVTLIHSRPYLLPTMKESLGEYTATQLRKRGVEVILSRRVKSVTAKQVLLDDDTAISAATVISTVGNAPHPLILELGKLPDPALALPVQQGRVLTNTYCQVVDHPHIWAAGDCAAVLLSESPETFSPPTAQFAMRQGICLGRNLAATLLNKPIKPFSFKGLGELAVIGHQTAVANILGLHFSGFFAWWLWRSIYLSKLPGIERKLRVVIDWTLDIFFPRDITLLNPRYTTAFSSMYLAPGDYLFKKGEPAFSFYMVKSGSIEIREPEGALIKTINPGGHFGERALLNDKIWKFDAIAKTDAHLIALNTASFQKLVDSSGTFSRILQKTAQTYQSQAEIDQILSGLPSRLRKDPVHTLMIPDPVTIPANGLVDNIVPILQNQCHSSYPVVDQNNKVTGVLRRTDFYNWLQNHEHRPDDTIETCPLLSPVFVHPEESLETLFERMIHAGMSKAVVIDSSQTFLGFITLSDLIHVAMAAV